MIQTETTKLLGIKHPIIGGAMMSITTPEFVAAISNAGGMGILASTIYKTPEDFEKAIDKTLELTGKPFAVNLSLFPGIQPVDNNLYRTFRTLPKFAITNLILYNIQYLNMN